MLPRRDGVREVRSELDRYLAKLHARLPVEAVVVAGSRARGGHCTDSDIDLVVVSGTFTGMPPHQRTELLLQDWFEPYTLQPQGYTSDQLLADQSLFLLDALWDGRPLEDAGCWEQARRLLLERMERNELSRTPGGWRMAPRAGPGAWEAADPPDAQPGSRVT